jgi:nicotinate dehydrogenase subunit A
MPVSLNVNGAQHTCEATPDTPLLYVLRNDIGINSAKYGCGVAQCGACTVILDGQAIRSCVVPASTASQGKITTLEGLGTTNNFTPFKKPLSRSRPPSADFVPLG